MATSTPYQLTPAAIVIFGITGDLARRKLLPALFRLANAGLLPQGYEIIGVTRSGTTAESLLDSIRGSLVECSEKCDEDQLSEFGKAMSVLTMDLSKVEEYAKLKQALDQHESRLGVCTNRLFYLAVPSQTFGSIAHLLGKSGLAKGCAHNIGEGRLLIEKPFGYDLESAKELIETLSVDFTEKQVYRVDHYLAKETAQNILTFRFSNPIFEAIWDRKSVRSIMVTAAESIGIEGRASFYEQTGALRDVLQSHLLQLLALVTMQRPEGATSEAVHAKKLELLRAVEPITADQIDSRTVRGQYEGYKQEVRNDASITETFAAVRLDIDTPQWQGVPMLLRTGKALSEKVTEITLEFKDNAADDGHDNTLTLRLQPNEGISIELQAKKPGFDAQTRIVQMDFCYEQTGEGVHPDAYERVLVDAMRGDKTLFATSDEVLASWDIVEAVVRAWSKNADGMQQYPKESWGPDASDRLAADAGTAWASQRLNVCPVPLPPRK